MRVRRIHPFDLSPKAAIALQRELAARIVTTGGVGRPRLVGGMDCSIARDGTLHACVVVCRAPDWHVVDEAYAAAVPPLPYISGLLSFRETPVELAALRALRTTPDVLLIDGQGLAHPRRLGIACHVGLFVDVPTIGVGKSRLCGEHAEPGPARGDRAALKDGRERLGTVLRTRDGVKPVYVSVGNAIGLASAERVVLRTATRYRLPEPIREADRRSRAKARGT